MQALVLWAARRCPTNSRYRRQEEWLLSGNLAHVGGLGTLAALDDVELHGLAFFQPATFLDGADVDEYVVTGLRLDEAGALVGSNHLTVPTGMLLALLRHLEASTTRRQATSAASDKLDCAAQSNATGAGARQHHAHRPPR
jgi:hypothetical protein